MLVFLVRQETIVPASLSSTTEKNNKVKLEKKKKEQHIFSKYHLCPGLNVGIVE